jgi:hypothetical protein
MQRAAPEHGTNRRLYHSLIRLITGPNLIMLLIILLGAIVQLVTVSADCHIRAVDTGHARQTNVSYLVTQSDLIDVDMCEHN